ncbi:MAG: helix-turn-helix domain-containing protein [bacterium]|nr:helix-turn-helix domain-containing protein [bacterium]
MKRNTQKFATARKLRKVGWSYSEIGTRLHVSKSTLSGWLKNVALSDKQRHMLRKKWEDGLKKARLQAANAHRQKTKERLALAAQNAEDTIQALGKAFYTNHFIKLFLSSLYLGEGSKNNSSVCFANANSNICKAFVILLKTAYKLDDKKFRCHLLIRADQKPKTLIAYWSRTLNIPAGQFMKSHADKRTVGRPSNKDYFGVCAIYYYDASIQKDLLSLGNSALEKLSTRAVSSAG